MMLGNGEEHIVRNDEVTTKVLRDGRSPATRA
jgi:hypothetical protein